MLFFLFFFDCQGPSNYICMYVYLFTYYVELYIMCIIVSIMCATSILIYSYAHIDTCI
jgi:hypothetical protein